MDVVIVGAGGHGKVVLDILRAGGRYRATAFLDADESLTGKSVAGVPVIGAINKLPRLRQEKIRGAIVAIGDNRARNSYAQLVIEAQLELINAIHPAASISDTVRMGKNIAVAAGAIIATDAVIHDSVIINTAAVIDHECEVGEAVHICPTAALAGRVNVGPGVFIGLGAKIIQCIRIGEHAVIGAGAVVIADVPAGATVVGVPARVIKTTSNFAQPCADT